VVKNKRNVKVKLWSPDGMSVGDSLEDARKREKKEKDKAARVGDGSSKMKEQDKLRKKETRDKKKANEKENADAEAAIEAQRQKERQNEHGSYYEARSNGWFRREEGWCFPCDEGSVPATYGHSPTDRVLLQPWSAELPPAPGEAKVTPALPKQGLLTQERQDALFRDHEDCIMGIHEKLHNYGTRIASCQACGRRRPDITIDGGCSSCEQHQGRSAAGIEVAPPLFSHGNLMSIMPPADSGSLQDQLVFESVKIRIWPHLLLPKPQNRVLGRAMRSARLCSL